MKSNDKFTREELRVQLQQKLEANDKAGFAQVFDQMLESIGVDLKAEYEQQLQDVRDEIDSRALATRGVRQLTSKERKYYQALSKAMMSPNPKQALTDLDIVMPQTVIDAVFEELRTNHPLLSAIDFMPTAGNIQILMNTNGYQEAVWGELCDEIVKEVTSGFKEINTGLMKLSAFLAVCKANLELGPEWLDRYVRETLYEYAASGLEYGIVDGTGKSMPIGMSRQVGAGVTVTDGVYPRKNPVKVNSFSTSTMGKLLAKLAVDESGKARQVNDLILLVNPQDYLEKVMPATTVMAPDGTYRNNVTPYPMTIIPTAALRSRGNAVLGIGNRYFAAAGTSREGRIEYSDHAKFLEDKRIYIIKIYANGLPKDNNSFLYLDISDLTPLTWRVEQVDAPTPSADANLSALSLGNAALNPVFNAATTTYTAATTNATNTVTATPSDADAEIKVSVNDVEIDNGSAATWATGSNTVKIDVAAANGVATKTYTVTVTKS